MERHFEGTLTARNAKQYILHRFELLPGSGRLALRLDFAPDRVYGIANLVTLTLFDPAGFRGARLREGGRHEVHLGPGVASPGYLPGPLPAGEWTVEIDTHMVMPGEPVRYTLDVTAEPEAEPGSGAGQVHAETGRPDGTLWPEREQTPGWYRGDLHTHTLHSDGGERTVAGLIAAARGARLDFIFLTDHNTTAGLAEMDARSTPELLAAGGIELTTYWGHALVLGTRQWIDWRVRPGTGEMGRLAAEAAGRDGLFIIAHPQSPGDPACTGCSWRFGDMMPGSARVVEIWNGPWAGESNNETSLALWYDWLNQGHRLAATAGTDSHGPNDYAARPGFNLVYAEALTEPALLAGIAAGHVILTSGPSLMIEAAAEDPPAPPVLPGGVLRGRGEIVVRWAASPPGAVLRLMANGRLFHGRPAGPEGEYRRATAPRDASWLTAELRASDGALLAITNPIFVE